ncbi:MAG: RHS repeat-associated core domain-containing protein, partial [Thermodesulfobacteriota bacterium]|nr:RHS repeat-associated core domain-containing protein [Thermodesulfobacteriota bacterium]
PDTYSVSNNIYLNGVRIAAMIPTGEALYYLTDQVDSVKVVVDDWANAVTRMEYLPYGETWIHEGDTDHAPKYNSQELDKETNFYFYNARHYDPEIARFVTPDKVLWKGGIKIYRKDV